MVGKLTEPRGEPTCIILPSDTVVKFSFLYTHSLEQLSDLTREGGGGGGGGCGCAVHVINEETHNKSTCAENE